MSVVSLPVLGFLAAILGLLLSPWWLLPAALLYLAWGICFIVWAFSSHPASAMSVLRLG
ncbi:MAG: hypothetical protein HZB64_10540 [Rhodocyclales bacterium]|nr:hypothetical protein [Rhodocyclales bacterium]